MTQSDSRMDAGRAGDMPDGPPGTVMRSEHPHRSDTQTSKSSEIPKSSEILESSEGPETIDDFLGGTVRLIQPRHGYRVSMDTVLLAAAIPAHPGDRVLDGGVGTGGAALCLRARVSGVQVRGVDIQDDLLDYARRNIAFNGAGDDIAVEHSDITALNGAEGTFDHVMINPPYLALGHGIRPPDASKGLAHMDSSASLKDWLRYCLYHARVKGTVTIIYRADRMDEVMAYLHRRVGELTVLPLWPRTGMPAKRVIIQGRKGVAGSVRLLPGLALHGLHDRYSAEAEAVLRDGAALTLR